MNIIICGAGRVGFTIAKLLSEQGHSITVIDQSSEDIQKINEYNTKQKEEIEKAKGKNPNNSKPVRGPNINPSSTYNF